jgi:replication factor C large subunit
MTEEPFSSKYCPKTSKELKGQDSPIAELREYIINYKTQPSKALLIYGSPGSGKTCAVHSVAADLGLEILEINASDFRNEEEINSIVGSASRQMSLFSKGKIILVDEIDGVAGREDRGGISALAGVIAKSSFPIIMTSNDPWDAKLSGLRAKAKLLKLNTPTYLSINSVLKDIAAKEGLVLDEETLKTIARRAGGDFRAAINDLQSISNITGISEEKKLESLDERNKVETIMNAIMKIFKTTSLDVASKALEEVQEDPEKCMLWIEENIPREYEKPSDIWRAYDSLSKSAVFMGRISRWQHWRFLVYVNLFSAGGVALAKEEKYHKFVSYKPSSRIIRLWRVSQSNKKRRAIAQKIAQATHTSTKTAIQDTLPYIRSMLKNDTCLVEPFSRQFGLDDTDVEWLKK